MTVCARLAAAVEAWRNPQALRDAERRAGHWFEAVQVWLAENTRLRAERADLERQLADAAALHFHNLYTEGGE